MKGVVIAEQFLEAPDVPAEDSGLNTYYSRDLVLSCIQAAIDAARAAAVAHFSVCEHADCPMFDFPSP